MIFHAVSVLALTILLPALILAGRTAAKNRDQREWLSVTIALSLQFVWCALIMFDVFEGRELSGEDCVQACVALCLSFASLVWVFQLRAGQKAARATKDHLVQSEMAYRLLFEKGSDAVIIFDASAKLIDVNDRACQMLGYPKEELLLLDPSAVVHHSTRGNVPAEMAAARQGISELYQHKMVRRDGTIVSVELSASPLPDGRLMATVRDKTEALGIEEKLQASHSMMSQASRLARIGYFTLNLETNDVAASDELYRLTELETGIPLRVDSLLERTHPDDIPEIQRELNRAIVEHRPLEIEYRAKLPSGVLRYLHALGKVDYDHHGNPLRALVVVQDITDRKYTERVLQENEERFRSLYTQTPAIMHSLDADSRITSVSRAWLEKFGYTEDEVIGRSSIDFLVPNEREYVRNLALPNLFTTGLHRDVPLQVLKKTGEVVDVRLTAYVERDIAGNPFRAMVFLLDVTDRLRAEAALREKNNILETLLNGIPGNAFLKDCHGVYIAMNRHAAEQLGKKVNEIVGVTNYQIFPLEEAKRFEAEDQIVISTGKGITTEQVIPQADGKAITLTKTKVPVFDLSGKVTGIIGLALDVTPLRVSQQNLERSLSLLKATLESTADGILVVDTSGRIASYNQRFLDLWNIPTALADANDDAALLTHVIDQLADPAAFKERVQYLYDHPTEHSFETIAFNDGRCFERYSQPQMIGDSVQGRVWSFRDITATRTAQRNLTESEARYRSLFAETTIGISLNKLILDDSGKPVDYTVIAVNPAFEQLTATSRDTLVGLAGSRLWPDSFRLDLDRYARTALTGESTTFESFNESVARHFECTVFSHAPGIVALAISDITERRRTVEALRNSERLHRSLVNLSPDGIFIFADGQIVFANEAFVRILNGNHQNDLLGIPVHSIVHPEFREMHDRRTSNVAGQVGKINPVCETILIRLDGSPVDVEVASVLINWKDRPAVQVIVRDITARKKVEQERIRLEEHLRLSQKLETIGTLAAGIAHDFNNLLVPIIGYTELTASGMPPDDEAQGHLSEVLRASYRAKSLVSHILTFSRQQVGDKRKLQLGSVAQETIPFLRSGCSSGIRLVQQIEDSLSVLADQTQMHQVIMNLGVNATQAMPSGGVMVVRICDEMGDLITCPGCGKKFAGPMVHLSIQDTGCGMSGETRKRIFDPFFSTKPVGQGSGLGLAVSHGIATQHNGHICVESELDVGSTFHLLLPAAQEGIMPDQIIDTLPEGGTESVMIVDDEPDVAQTIGSLLGSMGYKTTVVTGPAKALELFRQSPEQFDLILTDFRMPEQNGDKLAVDLLRIRPEIPIIIFSGHTDSLELKNARGIGIHDVLIKPVPSRELQNAIRKALEASSLACTTNS